MKQILFYFSFILLLSCNDGDIDIPDFDFSGITPDYQRCSEEKMVIYSINDTEALIIQLSEKNDTIFQNEGSYEYQITNNGPNKVIYRTFDTKPTDSYFCQTIPPTSPKTLKEWVGKNGTLIITVSLDRKDDNDGVVEEADDAIDTDKDGIPNYLDDDDDGDGILTSAEKNEDTDDDGTLNYLDDDDDGDSTPTINESATDDDDGDTIVNYLDIDSDESIITDRPITNNITEYYKTSLIIEELKLENTDGNTIQYNEYNELGSIEDSKVINN